MTSFRRWALSDESPDRGRFDFIRGVIEVEWDPEDLFTHGTLKGELLAGIATIVRASDGGYVWTRARFSSPLADLSAQPDITLVSYDSVESGTARFVPRTEAEPGRFVEIEGPPDLIVEVVSDSTVRKDTLRLPRAYFDAGVTEFWLADGRKDELTFVIHKRGETRFEPVAVDDQDFQNSGVLNQGFRLDRSRDRLGSWQYDLVSR